MCNIRCMYCKKYYVKSDGDKCAECDKQYKDVVASIIKRYGGVLKRLAER